MLGRSSGGRILRARESFTPARDAAGATGLAGREGNATRELLAAARHSGFSELFVPCFLLSGRGRRP